MESGVQDDADDSSLLSKRALKRQKKDDKIAASKRIKLENIEKSRIASETEPVDAPNIQICSETLDDGCRDRSVCHMGFLSG